MFNLTRAERLTLIFLTALLLTALLVILHNNGRRTQKITIRSFESAVIPASDVKQANRYPEYTVNINTANAEELMKLKGVGKVLAGRIIEYRNSKGLFLTISDIRKVGGIGPALYEKIKDNIRVE